MFVFYLEGRVGDDLERCDVIGVGGDGRWWKVTELGDVDSLIVNDLPVVFHNVLNPLGGVNSVVDNGRGFTRNNIVLKAGSDDRHGRRGPLDSVQAGVSCHRQNTVIDGPGTFFTIQEVLNVDNFQ